jgi:hypothetical protein
VATNSNDISSNFSGHVLAISDLGIVTIAPVPRRIVRAVGADRHLRAGLAP